jgi:DNA polymerase-3 subunit beta
MTTPTLAFETKKFALQQLIESAAAVVPSRDLVPVLKNFLIEASDKGLRVSATDLELAVVSETSLVTVETPGRAVIPAHTLLEILRSASTKPVRVEVTDNTATITISPTAWQIKLSDAEEFPPLPVLEDIDFVKVSRSKFVKALRGVRYAASRETHRTNLMLIDVVDGKARASDGVRFQQVDLGVEALPVDLRLPIGAVDDLLRLLTTSEVEEFQIGQDDNSIVFNIGGDTFITTKLNAEFPDVDNLLLKPALGNDEVLSVGVEDLSQAIKRVRVTADVTTSGIILSLTENKLVISSKDKGGNRATETLDVVWEAPDRTAAFNHQHLLQLLQMAEVSTATLKFGPDTKTKPSPLLYVDEAAGHVGLMSQLRLDWLS